MPAVQIECAHVPLPELLADVLLLAEVLPVVDMVTPQGLVTGMHTLAATPSAVLIGMQAWPDGQAAPLVQSVAQYVSPAN